MIGESRIVSFDLMPAEPDYYFVLTEALRDFAARQRSEAGDYGGADAEARIRCAETAEDALDQIEEALSTPATIEEVVALRAARDIMKQQALESGQRIIERWHDHPSAGLCGPRCPKGLVIDHFTSPTRQRAPEA